MSPSPSQPVELHLSGDSGTRISGLLLRPENARVLFVLAHGAGAGMEHPFLTDAAGALASCGIATLRYQFPYMEQKSRRPDPPAICHAAVRAAVTWAHENEPALPLIAGGKSFGGRMTSQAQALSPLPSVRGLAFLGFPLHPAKKPSSARADHLSKIRIPMWFVQGTRDALSDLPLMSKVVERLGTGARLHVIEGADHSFHVPARSGKTDSQVLVEIAAGLSTWVDTVLD